MAIRICRFFFGVEQHYSANRKTDSWPTEKLGRNEAPPVDSSPFNEMGSIRMVIVHVSGEWIPPFGSDWTDSVRCFCVRTLNQSWPGLLLAQKEVLRRVGTSLKLSKRETRQSTDGSCSTG